MVTLNPSANGRARKSLAEQIDRLDTILDGLAEGLNEAVATAAAGAVKEAVHAALIEVLTNPAVQQRLAASYGLHAPTVPTASRVVAAAYRCRDWLVRTAKRAWGKVTAAVATTGAKLTATVDRLVPAATEKVQHVRERVVRHARTGWMLAVALAALAKQFRTQLLVAGAAGVLVGVVCYFAGREVAAVGCGLAGFAGTVAAIALHRLHGLLTSLPINDV